MLGFGEKKVLGNVGIRGTKVKKGYIIKLTNAKVGGGMEKRSLESWTFWKWLGGVTSEEKNKQREKKKKDDTKTSKVVHLTFNGGIFKKNNGGCIVGGVLGSMEWLENQTVHKKKTLQKAKSQKTGDRVE